MGKKDKDKVKKLSAKKEKYLKFRKEKATSTDISMPDMAPEQIKEAQEAELRINKFLRFNKNKPILELREKKKAKKR